MKTKYIGTLVFSLFLITGNIQGQSFLKKLSDGIDKIGKEVDKAVDSLLGENQENVTTPPESSSAKAATTGVKPDYVMTTLRGNVKEIIETNVWNGKTTKNIYRFNENKQPTEIILTSYNGNRSLEVTCEYNPNGTIKKRTFSEITKSDDASLLGLPNELNDRSITEIPYKEGYPIGGLFYSAVNAKKETIFYEYDANGVLEKRTVDFTNSNEVQGRKEEFYTTSNGKIRKVIETMGSNVDEYVYDEKGDLMSHKKNGSLQPQVKNVYENYEYEDYEDYGEDYGEPVEKYDTKGRLISSSGDNGNKTYTYNANGDLTLEKTSDRWWGEASVAYTGYEYDASGNWTKRTVKKTGDYYGKTGVTVSTIREISYY
ncbi:MAG: hypothetical protein LUG18_06795 [Candidatus Azobacteroides sp.]|nr:hypothetical protein [Candidatus Azobacteroides sp.]